MGSQTRVLTLLMTILLLSIAAYSAPEIDIARIRSVAAKNNVTCILVFGDSSVDPGNNNHLHTTHKGNYPPYGKDFFNGYSTGRFSNGRLPTDLIAQALGYVNFTRGFLDPHLNKRDLLYSVSFASASAGYDDLTANLANVISLPKQLEYFKHYKLHLRRLVGEKRMEEIVENALYILSMGTNDFLQNYFVELQRSKQYTVEQYQDFLVSRMSSAVKGMRSLGARRLVVVGVPPFGCVPLIMTLRDVTKCDEALNKVAFSFSSKIKNKLATMKKSLGMQAYFLDIYTIIGDVIQKPKLYGFTEVKKGCCGSGTIEYGPTCRGLSTCSDRTKYVFWDAVHFTEEMYKIIASEALKGITRDFGK